MARTGVIIVAGGSGKRMGGRLPKQFLLLDGQPVLARTINLFAKALPGAQIVAVLPEEQIEFWKNLSARFDVAAHTSVSGGSERFHSVANGLQALAPDTELIAVHDGVRPLLSVELIRRMVAVAETTGAAIPVVEPVDSVRQAEGMASHIIDRSTLRLVQTPQTFRAELLRKAYEMPFSPGFTDDASVVEAAGGEITLCEGERMNLKITTPEDLALAEALLSLRRAAETQTSDDNYL